VNETDPDPWKEAERLREVLRVIWVAHQDVESIRKIYREFGLLSDHEVRL